MKVADSAILISAMLPQLRKASLPMAVMPCVLVGAMVAPLPRNCTALTNAGGHNAPKMRAPRRLLMARSAPTHGCALCLRHQPPQQVTRKVLCQRLHMSVVPT